jgi:hypothetical protein
MQLSKYSLMIFMLSLFIPSSGQQNFSDKRLDNLEAYKTLKIRRDLKVQQVVLLKHTDFLIYELIQLDLINGFLAGKNTAPEQFEQDIFNYQINIINYLSDIILSEAKKHIKTPYIYHDIDISSGKPFKIDIDKWKSLIENLSSAQKAFQGNHNVDKFLTWKTANITSQKPPNRQSILNLLESVLAVQSLNAKELRRAEAIKHQKLMELLRIVADKITTHTNKVANIGYEFVVSTPSLWPDEATSLFEEIQNQPATELTRFGKRPLQIAEQERYESLLSYTIGDIEEIYKNDPLVIGERISTPLTFYADFTEKEKLRYIQEEGYFFWYWLGFTRHTNLESRLLHEFHIASAGMFSNIFDECKNCLLHPLLKDESHEIYINVESYYKSQTKWKTQDKDIFPFDRPYVPFTASTEDCELITSIISMNGFNINQLPAMDKDILTQCNERKTNEAIEE